jgi:hypothetical protein
LTDWEAWYSGVMAGVQAPVNAITEDVCWAWSNAESGADVMRWLNPLNSSWYLPGAVAENSIPIWRYLTVQDGIDATVLTLLGGPRYPDPFPQYYPIILANLRGSVPRAQWGNACPNLGTWGTGCGWLQSTYGPVPGILGEDMTPDESLKLTFLFNDAISGTEDNPAGVTATVHRIEAELAALKTQVAGISAGTTDLAPVLTAIAAIETKLGSLSLKFS